jgi:hypothetical protein
MSDDLARFLVSHVARTQKEIKVCVAIFVLKKRRYIYTSGERTGS